MILIWLAFYLAHSFCLITLVSPATRQRYAKTPKGWQHWLSLTLFYSIPASFLWADDPQPLTVLASFLLFTAGSTLAIWAVRSNPWFSPAIEMPPTVVTDGAYALISHPGYCGFAMMAGASWLMVGATWALIPLGVYWLLLAWRGWRESELLQERQRVLLQK